MQSKWKWLEDNIKNHTPTLKKLVHILFIPVHIKRNLSCAKKFIQLLEEVSHLHRYPEFIQPKVLWVEEGSWRKIYFCINWNERNERSKCEGIKDRAEHQHIRSISITTYVQEKISHHLWKQIINMPTMKLVFELLRLLNRTLKYYKWNNVKEYIIIIK